MSLTPNRWRVMTSWNMHGVIFLSQLCPYKFINGGFIITWNHLWKETFNYVYMYIQKKYRSNIG